MKEVNCYILDDDLMQSAVLVDFISSTEGLQIVGVSQEPLEAIKFFAKNDGAVDLLYLDVEMPVMTGLEFLQSISYQGQVVLVTSNANYALESYSYNVLDFLLKPVSYERFLDSLLKFQKFAITDSVGGTDSIYLKVNNSLKKFLFSEVLYCKGADDYVEIITKKKKYLASTSLTKLVEKLPAKIFVRIHRSIIVNTNSIAEVEPTGVIVEEDFLPVSKTYRKTLLNHINVI